MNERNYKVDILKLIAAWFVVFIHVLFPGDVGNVIDCIARFAVPFFFAISGYFSYMASIGTITRQLKKIIRLFIYSLIFYLIWKTIKVCFLDGDSLLTFLQKTFNLKSLSNWIYLEKPPLSEHLWYLTAMCILYILFLFYLSLQRSKINYRPLYVIAACSLLIYIVFSYKIQGTGGESSILIYRNALFLGMPLFTIGLFLNEYKVLLRDKLRLTKLKLIVAIITGLLLSCLQYFRIGKSEMPIFMLFVCSSLIYLSTNNYLKNTQSEEKIKAPTSIIAKILNTNILSNLSIFIYITHIFFRDLGRHLFPDMNAYVFPLLVAFVTTVIGIIYLAVLYNIKKKIRKI